MPIGFAIIEGVQWVGSTGGSVRVSATTRSAISDPSGGIREGRVLSRRRPHTGLRLSSPPHNLTGADAVRAQQNNLRAPDMLTRRVAIPSERRQTAAVTGLRVMEIPIRMRASSTRRVRRESLFGFTCKI
jgi:hypothetical protein